MKRLSKVFINVIAVIMCAVACFGVSGCKKDMKTVELKIAVYDYENKQTYAESEVTMTIDLYRHLAPNTVDKIIEYINDGYYNDAVFYRMSAQSSQIMLGDLKFDGDSVYQNEIMPMIDGEFEYGGTTGSNLVNEKGSIGLWRTWTAYDANEYYKTNTATDTGRATWYMPTNDIVSYNKWFCVFGKFNLDSASTSKAFSAIETAFSDSGYYEEYVIYYTGEYDETKPNENFGLTFNCVPKADFNEDMEGLFVAEGAQHVCYNHYTVQIPLTGENGTIAAKVVSAKVK